MTAKWGTGLLLNFLDDGTCILEPMRNGRARPLPTVPVHSDFERLLLETPVEKRSGLLFADLPKHRSVIEETIRHIGNAAGIRLHSADLRISWAKRQLGKMSPELIGAISRYKDPAATRRFCDEAARLSVRSVSLRPAELPDTLHARRGVDRRKIARESLRAIRTREPGDQAPKKRDRITFARSISSARTRQAGDAGRSHRRQAGAVREVARGPGRLDDQRTLAPSQSGLELVLQEGSQERLAHGPSSAEPEPHRRAWSVEEVRRLLAACDAFTMQGPRQEAKATSYDGVPAAKWWRLFHLVAWECGERTGALLELKWAWLSGTGLDVPAEAERDVASGILSAQRRLMAELEHFAHQNAR